MNNKCGCGQGFVPVSGNWDFNMDGGSMPGSGCQRQRQNRCNACETAETNCRRNRQADCADRNACQKNACTGRADCTCENCMRCREAEYNNCTFTSTTSNKYAVNIDASYSPTKVVLNGCSQTGTPGLYAVTGAKATVWVDGVQQ